MPDDAREIRKFDRFEIDMPDTWKDDDDDSDDDDDRRKRVVRMALLANLLMAIGQGIIIGVSPRVYLELDVVVADCPLELNGIEVNRSEFNRTELNGTDFNGTELNGTGANGTALWESLERAQENCIAGVAGELTGNLAALNAAFEFLSAGALGMLSDSFGRKAFCISAAVGMLLDMGALTYAVGSTPGGTTLMFFARAAAGALGNQEIFIRAALADVSTSEEAPANFGSILFNVGLGLVIGVGGGTLISHAVGSLRGGSVFGFVCIFMAVVVLLAMPEPLAKRHRKSVQWSLANPLGAMRFLFSTRYFILFAVMSLVDKTAFSLCFSNLGIFCIAAFGEVGRHGFPLLLMFCGVMIGVICKTLLPPTVRGIGVLNTVKLGYILTSLGFICVAVVTPLRVFGYMFPALLVFCLGAISGPTQTSVATLCVDESQQGTLQGAVGSVEVIGRVLGPFTGALVWRFAAPAGHFTLLWWGGAALMIPGVVISFLLPNALPKDVVAQLLGNVDDFVMAHRKSTVSVHRKSTIF